MDKLMKQPVLITGSFGYIGGRIAHTLSEHKGFDLRLGTRNAESRIWKGHGKVIPLDIMSDKSLDDACRGAGAIIHLAAVNEIESASDPEKALQTNSTGTLKLLRAAERADVTRFIYFSTAHVYGPLKGEITENSATRPLHPYAITHRTAEDFVLAAHERGAFTGIVLRLSNGTGAPADPGVNRWTLIGNDLCRQAVTTKKLVLHSSGIQQRDFIPLSDVADAVLHMLKLPSEACGDGLFNLGGENSMRIIDFAQLVAERCKKILGFYPPITKPIPKQDEKSYSLNFQIDKIKATGFRLKGSLSKETDATLKLCAEAFDQQE
ncbi:MAG: SDR family oxidoreductase [Desulfobacteraceae bacterium]|nr:SDR family oxidoreductase [Desulfobacteraceae bacterium]